MATADDRAPRPAVVPDGYTAVTPWMIGPDTGGTIEFLTAAFEAEELFRVADEDGVIGHAEVRIGDAVVMLFDRPSWPPTPAFLRLYVEDVEATLARAVAAGGTVMTRPTRMAWGDVVARVTDPFGNLYWVHERVEEVDEATSLQRMSDPTFVAAMEYVRSSLTLPEPDR